MKKHCHNNYMYYETPDDWCVEYEEDSLLIYNQEDGEGAMVLSFFSDFDAKNTLVERISQMGKSFVEKNGIQLEGSLMVTGLNAPSKVLSGHGTLPNGMYIKLWIIASYPKIVVISYQSEERTEEIEICDNIVDSINFDYSE